MTAALSPRHRILAALPWAVLFGGLALYGLGASPGLAILDSGEFLGAAATLGISHPSGYPLYALWAHLFTLLPWGDLARNMNWASAFAGAWGAFFFARAAGEFGRLADWGEGRRAVVTAICGLTVLVGRTLWTVSTLAEVYALNACLLGALLWMALRIRRTGARRELYVFALVAGLALANHMTIGLFIAASVAVAWPGKERARLLLPALPFAFALALVGASLNLYMPIRAARVSLFNWNVPSTLPSLYAHLSGYQYRGNLLSTGLAGVKTAAWEYVQALWYNAFPAGIWALAGIGLFFRRGFRSAGIGLVLYLAAYFTYCIVYDIPDINFYFIPLHVVVAFLTAAGAGAILAAAAKRREVVRRVIAAAVAITIVGAAVWTAARNAPVGWRRGYIFSEYYGDRLLEALPYRALFLPGGDTNTFLTWYNCYVRWKRPDIAILDQIRVPSRGYLAGTQARYPDLKLPTEEAVNAMAVAAVARREFTLSQVTFNSSDDFILPELLAGIIADNAGRRPMFWGLGDPGKKLSRYIIPYGLVMEIRMEPPPRPELRARAEASVRALASVTAHIKKEGPSEYADPFFHILLSTFYRGLGERLLGWGEIAPQEGLFRSYVDIFPTDPNGLQNLGAVYALTGRPVEAIPYYRRAIAYAPKNQELRFRLFRCLLEAGRTKEAAAEIDALDAKKVRPGQRDYMSAVLARVEGKPRAALAAFERATPHYPRDPAFWWEKGLAYVDAGNPAGAVRSFDRALALDPENAKVYTARGVAYTRMGNKGRARADFEAALARNPMDAQAHYNLACSYALDENDALALEHLAYALELNTPRYLPMCRADADLASLRRSPDFALLLAEFGP